MPSAHRATTILVPYPMLLLVRLFGAGAYSVIDYGLSTENMAERPIRCLTLPRPWLVSHADILFGVVVCLLNNSRIGSQINTDYSHLQTLEHERKRKNIIPPPMLSPSALPRLLRALTGPLTNDRVLHCPGIARLVSWFQFVYLSISIP